MNLELNISSTTAAWLEQKARAAGISEAVAAAQILDNAATQELSHNGTPRTEVEKWLAEFDRFVASVPKRPGPPVDASRAKIYE